MQCSGNIASGTIDRLHTVFLVYALMTAIANFEYNQILNKTVRAIRA
jgi:hypothetical protein